MSAVLRAAKYSMKGYNGVQTKVRDATSNDPQPPTGSMLNELSQLTYNPDDFLDIALVLGKRLDDKGRNWRHVYKSLVVLDYLLHSGSEAVVLYFQKNVYVIKTLKEFQYVDEEGKDQGANVRIKATDIANLILDEPRLRQIRRSRAEMRDRMMGRLPRPESDVIDEDMENENVQRRSVLLVPHEDGDDEDAVRVQSAKAQIRLARAAEDKDLMRAFQLSQDDENKRTPTAQQPVLAGPLFDEPASMTATTPSVTAPPAVTTPMPQQQSNELAPLVVFDGMDQMSAPQPPPQIMPQIMPQYTSFNPFHNLQAQQEMLQAEQLRQQQEWINLQAAQQQLQQQQEEWLRQQMMHQQQQQVFQQQQAFQLFQPQASSVSPFQQQPSPVRSNNPFAPSASPLFSTATQASSLPSPTSSSPSPTLLTPSSPDPPSTAFLTSQQPQRKPSPFNAQHLDQLFANRDDAGMDTFGNVGQLRYGHNFSLQSA